MLALTTTQSYSAPVDVQAPAPLARGALLGGRYLVEKELGRGGSGIVFRAADHLVGGTVALKVLAPGLVGTRAAARRFAREVRLARMIRHAHVCPVFDLAHVGGHTFLTMELARGSLADERGVPGPGDSIDLGTPVAWERRLADGRAVCEGLAAIHAAGVAHLDLKPQNVLRMGDQRLAIADFGMAICGPATAVGGGTPHYLPPEVILGLPTDQRSDMWQLGFLLYEILLGVRPRWRLRAGHPVVPEPAEGPLPREVAALLSAANACLSFCPDERPTSADLVRPRAGRARRRSAQARSESQCDSIQASESGQARSSRSSACTAPSDDSSALGRA